MESSSCTFPGVNFIDHRFPSLHSNMFTHLPQQSYFYHLEMTLVLSQICQGERVEKEKPAAPLGVSRNELKLRLLPSDDWLGGPQSFSAWDGPGHERAVQVGRKCPTHSSQHNSIEPPGMFWGYYLQIGQIKILLTAPSIILKISHRKPHRTTLDVGVYVGSRDSVQSGQRKIPRNPVSSSCDSHPRTIAGEIQRSMAENA